MELLYRYLVRGTFAWDTYSYVVSPMLPDDSNLSWWFGICFVMLYILCPRNASLSGLVVKRCVAEDAVLLLLGSL